MEKKQCIVCYKIADERSDNVIRCFYCGSLSHSECVSEWLVKYNACPLCQNRFVVPKIILITS